MTSIAPCHRISLARPALAGLLAFGLATGGLRAAGWASWTRWPDLSHAPDPAAWSGWSEAELARVWSPLGRFRVGEDGAMARTDARRLKLHPGERLAIFYRAGDRQGLAGNAEVVAVDATGTASLRVRLAHLMLAWDHDPWKGWVRTHAWRPGHEPGRVRYFVSRQNLSGRPAEEFEAIRTASIHRGMWGPDLLRAWGAPTARGDFDYARGRQEQWTFEPEVDVRYYVYLDAGTGRVTGWHHGRVQ